MKSILIPAIILSSLKLVAQDVQIDSSSITATASAQFSADFGPEKTIDGETLEGFRGTGDAGPPVRPANHQFNHWITPNGSLTATITFDLGDTYDLTRIEVLNTSNSNWNDRETDTFTIATSTDGGGTYSAPSDPVALQDYTTGFQEVSITANGVTHVQFVVSNDPALGTNNGTEDAAVGLNEVRFFTPEPEDSDSDGLPDDWEIDHFGNLTRGPDDDDDVPTPDGLNNLGEFNANTDPLDADSDDDTLTDGDEVNLHGSDPNLTDTDGDTLSDADEVNLHNSNPTLADSDGDTLSDLDEITIHMTRPDLADSDGDNLPDSLEILHLMTDPNTPDLRPDLIPPYEISVTAGSEHSAPFPSSNLVDDMTLEGFQNTGDPGPPERPTGHQNNHWITPDGTLTETVTFDLGGTYDLTRIEVLNTSNSNWNDRETDTFTIATSTDGGTTFSDPSDPVALQDYTTGFQAIPVSATGVTHVQLIVTNDTALGTDTGTADVAVGLNEVRFYLGNVAPLQITSLTFVPGTTSASITWNSTPGSNYLVEFSDDLIQWDEAPDGEAVPASSNATTTFTVEYDPPIVASKRFFRVTKF
jgi:hypothetical protein